jgi:hypothetical protein
LTKSSRWWELCSRVSGHPGARLQMSAVLLLAIPGLVGSAPHMALASLQFGRPPWHAARPMTPIMQLGNPLANFFGKKEEASKKKKESALTTGLDALVKDAPLPVRRPVSIHQPLPSYPSLQTNEIAVPPHASLPSQVKLMAGMMKPLIGGLAAAIQESQEDADQLLVEAQSALRADGRITSMLGQDVVVGAVFSTASSSSSMNGVTTKQLSLQCQCSGSSGASGVVAIRGESDGSAVRVVSLQVQAGGQVIDVPTLRGGGLGGGMNGMGGGTSGGGGGAVIDVDAS